MFVRDFDHGVITYWNDGAERLYGWTRAEAIGRRPAELLGSVYPIPIGDIEEQLKRTGLWEGEIRQRRKDGSPITVACRWGLQVDAEGGPESILEINADITNQRDLAEELQRTEESFRLLVSSTVDYAIYLLDHKGRVVSWNDGAQRIKGYTAEEIIGRNFSVFFIPEEVEAGKPQRELEVAEREGHYAEEGWRVRKDGSRFWASVVITALRDEEGRLRGFGKVTRDITDRKLEEERREVQRRREIARLRQHASRMAALERSKSQFLNLASHELRGPLTVVRGYISMLEDGSIPPDQMAPITKLLGVKLAQMELLIQQMLETARLEDERMGLRQEVFDLGQLAEEQIDGVRPLVSDHELILVRSSLPALVHADRGRIGTVIANLLDNAIKYSPAGGEILCTVGASEGRAYMTVRDPGVGIAPEHLELLFARFTRLPTERNITLPGTGLGLYLCRDIARRHGGDIEVESQLEAGSTFTLRLPLAVGDTAAATAG
ncbi:MAG: PAS domain-containing sensor histidine kinase [Chloroflexi bacterium]|nr:MAG: PAS domain-containing sensor histidine kinase [Chloroflexota bacterium]